MPSRADTAGARIDPDPGVAGFDHATVHRHAFKTPSLRNVELTAPYMHNGVYRTLEDVVDFYDRGGAGIGIELPNQTLSPEPLRLSGREKRDLIAFLGALTDTTQVARNRPHRGAGPGCTAGTPRLRRGTHVIPSEARDDGARHFNMTAGVTSTLPPPSARPPTPRSRVPAPSPAAPPRAGSRSAPLAGCA